MVTLDRVNAQIALLEKYMNTPELPESQKKECAKGIAELNAIKADLGAAPDKINNKYNPGVDSVSFTNKNKPEVTDSLSVKDKQAIMKKAKTSAAGWSAFGGLLSSVYYAIQSDKHIADKYNLNPETDKDFIDKIKKEQVKSTIPGALGFGIVGWIYNKVKEEGNFDVA